MRVNHRLAAPMRPVRDLPVVCTLSPGALKARRANLLSGLLRRAGMVGELPDGYRLEFPGDDETLLVIAQAGGDGVFLRTVAARSRYSYANANSGGPCRRRDRGDLRCRPRDR